MSNHNETVTATAVAATAAIDARARQCGVDFLTSSRKVPSDLRDCIAGWSGKPWVAAKTLGQAELTEHVMRFLMLARRAWEENPLDRQSMDLWTDFGKRVASGLKTSSLDGCTILCRARADSESAMGKKIPKSGSILGYDCWGRANDSTESGTKSRWLEIQINSPKETSDITDHIPNVLSQAIEPDLSEREDVGLTVRLTEARTVGTQAERAPTHDIDGIRRESEIRAGGRSARLHWVQTYRRDVENNRLRETIAKLEAERDALLVELETMKALAKTAKPRKTKA